MREGVVHLLYPNDIHQMFYLLEFRVAGHQSGFVFHRRGKGKTVGIREGVLSLIFSGLEYQVTGIGKMVKFSLSMFARTSNFF